jgi:serine/arginine repetitive matrix protein 2
MPEQFCSPQSLVTTVWRKVLIDFCSYVFLPLTEIIVPETRASDANELSIEERTPKVRTIPPPPVEASETIRPASPTQKMTYHSRNGFQKAAASGIPSTSTTSVDPGTFSTLGESSSAPSPSSPQPSVPSILSTPPRRTSFGSTPKFQTPSPPKGMPELPGPPSSSSGEDEQRQISFTQPSSNGMRPDFSAIKTPRPPGGWSSTPRQPHYESEQGSLASTSDADHENGLALPVSSLSMFSSLPARTPAPPGAWMATPAARRPLQKVRFDNQDSRTMHSMTGRDIDSSNSLEDGLHSSSQPNNTSVLTEVPDGLQITPPPNEESTLQPARESSDTQVSPRSRSSNTPRKLPSIRVLDAFGREQLSEDASLDGSSKVSSRTRRRTSVRVLDAMGRDVKGDEVSPEKLDEPDRHIAPLNHAEVFTSVRQGLTDLAQGLDDMDR